MSDPKTVKATREGLVGKRTASGYIIDTYVPYVALPSTKALFKFVLLTNPENSLTAKAVVLDIGPWDIHDDDYVFGTKRPRAESGFDEFGRTTNKAGIDLGEKVWRQLGMSDNGSVSWQFLD